MSLIVDTPSLQTAVVEYLARDQDTVLIARVPTFIQLFEAKMNRDLLVRQMETRSQTVTDPTQTSDPEFVALPPDFQMMRRLSITATTGVTSGVTRHRKRSLEYITPTQMDEFKQERRSDGGIDSGFGDFGGGGGEGHSRFYTIFGNEIELYPTPHQVTTLEMIYRQNLPPLSANPVNWLLTLAPDIYLYGALLESAPYIKEDNRISVWATGMTNALNDLNRLSSNLVFAAGPMQVRVDRGGGGSRGGAGNRGF